MQKSKGWFCQAAIVLAVVLLHGCGGGGGGGEAATAGPATSTGKAPGETYLVNGDGGIGTASFLLDVEGTFSQEGETVTLRPSTGPSGCTLNAVPTDTDLSVCNQLAGGAVFVACKNTTGDAFTVALFNARNTVTGSLNELKTRTLQNISCGATGVRNTGYTLSVLLDGGISYTGAGLSSANYHPGPADSATQPNGIGFGPLRERFVIYKTQEGTSTNYFVLHVWENSDVDGTAPPPDIYWLKTP